MNFEDYESLPTSNIFTHMTAGAIAGVMEHCVMYPLDSVKTRMQSFVAPGTQGISETFLKMVKHEGIFRPVRGMSAVVVGAGPSHALYFSSYEYLKNAMIMHTTTERYHTVIYGASGCISTLLHDGIMNPAEVVKQRMQMLNSPYRSALQCFIGTYKNEGFRAFYRSYTTQLTMNVPFQSIHFMIYEFMQNVTNKERKYNPIAHMFSGAMAGAIAAAITTPLDVCKTLLNTQQGVHTTGMIEAVKKVYQLGGPMGFFRGLRARVMYQMPSTMICWTTYEFFKYLLNTSSDVRLLIPVLADTDVQTPKNDTSLPSSTSPSSSSSTSSSSSSSSSSTSYTPSEKINIKPRELPAMSGAGLYSSITFNTMHTADNSFNNRRTDSIIDIIHS